MIDLYCERTGPGLWAEPLNVLSNAAFLVAAWAAWRTATRWKLINRDTIALVVLMVLTGIGSGLFHTFATPFTRALGYIPVFLFQVIFLWLYGRRIARIDAIPAAISIALFLVTVLLVGADPEILNGSVPYLPALGVLLVIGVYHYRTGRPGPAAFLVAAGLFLAALIFRTFDIAICERVPVGTHFLWHLLNGLLVYGVTRAFFFALRP